jgi:hypothetical protein
VNRLLTAVTSRKRLPAIAVLGVLVSCALAAAAAGEPWLALAIVVVPAAGGALGALAARRSGARPRPRRRDAPRHDAPRRDDAAAAPIEVLDPPVSPIGGSPPAPTRLIPRRTLVATTVGVGIAAVFAGFAAGWTAARIAPTPAPVAEPASLLARYASTRRELRRRTVHNELVVRGLAADHCRAVFATALPDSDEAASRCAEWFDRRVDEFQACARAELEPAAGRAASGADGAATRASPAGEVHDRIVTLCSRTIDQVFQPGSTADVQTLVRLTLDWWATRAALDAGAR